MPRQHENDPIMNDSVHQMSLLVGQLDGRLESLTASVENLNTTWGERERTAVEGRRILHDKVEAMRHDMMKVGADVENLAREVTTVIKPAVETFKTERDQHQGAARLGKRLWLGAVGLSSLFGGGVAELFHRWR